MAISSMRRQLFVLCARSQDKRPHLWNVLLPYPTTMYFGLGFCWTPFRSAPAPFGARHDKTAMAACDYANARDFQIMPWRRVVRPLRVKSVAFRNRRPRLDFPHTPLATKLARHCDRSQRPFRGRRVIEPVPPVQVKSRFLRILDLDGI
jgi:hypothetical protein